MELPKTNNESISAPIDSVPGVNRSEAALEAQAPQDENREMITVPEEYRVEARPLGGAALSAGEVVVGREPIPLPNGRSGNGVVVIENPGAATINHAINLPPDMIIRR